MGKVLKAYTIDPEIAYRYEALVGKGQVSGSIEEHMRQTIAAVDYDEEGINIEILRTQSKKLQKEIIQNQAELQSTLSAIDSFEKRKEEADQKRMLDKKEEMRKKTTCAITGKSIDLSDEKSYVKIKDGVVSASAFLERETYRQLRDSGRLIDG